MTATLFGIFCQKRSDSVYTERKVKWGLSCGSEGFQNKNKLFLLNPNSVQLQPSPDFMLDMVALLTYPLPLQIFAFRVLSLKALYFLFSDHAFWQPRKHLFPRLLISTNASLFQWVNSSHEVAKVLEFQFQYQSFEWTSRTYLLQDGLVGSPYSPRDSQESSPTPQFKSTNFLVLSFLQGYSKVSFFTHDAGSKITLFLALVSVSP